MTLDREFMHGHTYQGHALGCAAALEVQRIVREENLIDNVKQRGVQLEKLLQQHLGNHPNVGNIRGKGLFWGVSQPFCHLPLVRFGKCFGYLEKNC